MYSPGFNAWQAGWNQLSEHFNQQAYGLVDESRSVLVPSFQSCQTCTGSHTAMLCAALELVKLEQQQGCSDDSCQSTCHNNTLKLWDKPQDMCLVHPFLLCRHQRSALGSVPCRHFEKHDKERLCLLNSSTRLEIADLLVSYEQQCVCWPNFYCLNTASSPS